MQMDIHMGKLEKSCHKPPMTGKGTISIHKNGDDLGDGKHDIVYPHGHMILMFYWVIFNEKLPVRSPGYRTPLRSTLHREPSWMLGS